MRGRHWARTALAAVTVLVALVALSGCAGPEEPPRAAGPLRILLVNDDGPTAPGTVLLRDALRRAGYTVVQVTPSADRSTAGTATTMAPAEIRSGPIDREGSIWTVTGTPADAALAGFWGVMGSAQPDLVISGINAGPNVSTTAMLSGAVGAALVASGRGFPSVVVSTDVPDRARAQPRDFVPTVDFTVRMVATLARERVPGTLLLPIHTVLNVNYPRGPARGVAAVRTSDYPASTPSFRPGSRPGSFMVVPQENRPMGEETDAGALSRGQVAISDLSSDPDRSQPPARSAARLAPRLQP